MDPISELTVGNSELSTTNQPQQLPDMVGSHGTSHIQLWEPFLKMGVPDLRKTNRTCPPFMMRISQCCETWDGYVMTLSILTQENSRSYLCTNN
jgi:hypothetical protein